MAARPNRTARSPATTVEASAMLASRTAVSAPPRIPPSANSSSQATKKAHTPRPMASRNRRRRPTNVAAMLIIK